MKKNNKNAENYLEKVPLRKETISWTTDSEGKVTLEIENKGLFNRMAQKFFKKPKVSFIHLDEMGSFVWPVINGEMNLTAIAGLVDEHFGESAHPLYERLAKYFQILDSYGFIEWKK